MLSSNSTTPTNLTSSQIFFRLQCGSTSLYQWVNLLTVCLAPLVTHVVFGFADPVLLSDQPPRWYDRLAQFSPITIIWRWLAIVNRRIRALDWDRADMAATNAIFWTGSRWDGSEEIMLDSRDWITKLPQDTHVNWMSGSTLATIAMTLQGLAAVFRLNSVPGEDWRADTWALPDIYYPIAVLSLTRLPASLWLSSEYGYNTAHLLERYQRTRSLLSAGKSQRYHVITQQYSLEEHPQQKPNRSSRLGPNTASSRLWTILCLFFTFGGCGAGAYLACSGMGPKSFVIITSASSLTMMIYYLLLCASGGLIMTYYLLRGRGGETAIPCMNSLWYQLLNGLIMVAAIIMFVITALETKMQSNGQPVTYQIPPP